MNAKKHLLEAATLVAAAVVCALVANAVAGRERKVNLWSGGLQPAVRVAGGAATPNAPAGAPAATVGGLKPAAPQAAITATEPNTKHPLNPATQQPSNPTTQQPATGNHQPTPAPAPAPVPPPRDLTTAFPPHPDKPYIEVHGDDVAFLHRKGVLFLDARRTSVYEQGHIAGARPFSVWEADVDEKVNKLFAERGDPREQALPIVIYCSGGDCEDSHMLAQKLWGIQFNNVYVYKDGFPDWVKRGGSVHAGGTL